MRERASTMKVAGQEFKVSTPDRVFYPATGTNKADVIAYYVQVVDVMLPHLAGRPATRKGGPTASTARSSSPKTWKSVPRRG